MPISQVVVNASPLIALFKSGQADLLPQLFEEIVVPQGVWEEVTTSKPSDVAAQQLKTVLWVRQVQSLVTPVVAAWDLGKGESEVLSWVTEHLSYAAIVDDLAARRCAASLGLTVLGTGSILLLAKRRGLIPTVKPRLQALKDAGLYLSDKLVELLVNQAEE
ncbi:MAG: DUF3368 domain-containing protein [Elainellaceae cyanobacterium]